MGTGSFGGGSGGFGGGSGGFGGGSGGLGGGGFGGGRPGATRGPGPGGGVDRSARRRGGSVFDRILALITLTRHVNEHPEKTKARKTVIAALETRSRRKYLLEILGNALVDGVYRDLFELRALVTNGLEWSVVARQYGLDPERATLGGLTAAIVERHRNPAVDERFVEIASGAVRDLLLKAVGDDFDLYYEARSSRDLERAFVPSVLDNTADRFIAGILFELVRRDVLDLSDEARAMLGEVFREIGKRWCDMFAERSHTGEKVEYSDLLAAIAREPSSFPVSS